VASIELTTSNSPPGLVNVDACEKHGDTANRLTATHSGLKVCRSLASPLEKLSIGWCANEMPAKVPFLWRIYFSISRRFETRSEKLTLQGKTNFFERRVGEYQRAGVMAGMKPSAEKNDEYTFTTDADF